jgi:hypothetical protein
MPISVNGANGITFADGSIQNTGATGFGFKNRIINGDMRVAQRGTTTSVGVDMYGGCDRWKQWAADGGESGRCTMSQSTDAPAGFAYSQQLAVTTAQASVSAAHAYQLVQRIETLNCQDLGFGQASKYITVSFWAKSTKAGVYNVTMYFAGASSNKVNVREVTLSSTWTKYTLTFVTDSSQAVNSSITSYGLIFGIGLMAGSNWRSGSTSDSWAAHTGTNWFTSNQVNFYDSTSNTFNITGVQVEKGSVATDFDYRDYGRELQLCQRYFSKLGGTNSGEGLAIGMVNDAPTAAWFVVNYPTTMRAAPTMSYSNISVSNQANYTYAATSIRGQTTGLDSASFGLNFATGGTTFTPVAILTNTTAGNISMSAEL